MIDSKDISVVVQGAIDKENTPKCLASIRKHLPNAEIILSTWEGADVEGLDYDIILFNKDPGGYIADLDNQRTNNCNRQIISTTAGVNKASKKYILKLRTDLILKGIEFLKYFDKMSNYKFWGKKYKVFSQKVIVLTLFTRHYIGNGTKRYNTPFHVSDWVLFGCNDDIKNIWSIPLQQEPEFSQYFINKPERQHYEYPTRTWKFPPEQYIFYNFFKKFNSEIFMQDMLNYDPKLITLSDKYIKSNFIILSPAQFSLYTEKYDDVKLENFYSIEYKNSLYSSNKFLLKKIADFLFKKFVYGNKRLIVICGLRINYKKNKKIDVKMRTNRIRLVEIEIFSYCNRRCWFCPNSYIDRHSNNILMDEKIYIKILQELKRINYSNIISFSRYNEPTSHKEFFLKRLKQASEILPNALLHTNTNGDFLNKVYLEEMYNAGLRSMNIQCYLRENEEFNIQEIKSRIINTAKKLELDYKFVKDKDDWCEAIFIYKDMKLKMYARNFKLNGNNRAGSLKTIQRRKRNTPCYIPLTDIYIDYNGSVLPCCNFRSDIKAHKKFIIGKIKLDTDLFKMLNNKRILKFRQQIAHGIPKIYPCSECTFAEDYKIG